VNSGETFGRRFLELHSRLVWQEEWTLAGRLFPKAGLNGNPFSSLGPAAGKHGLAAFCFHTSAKTVRLGPAPTVGLKSALRHLLVGLLLRIVHVGQTLSIKNLADSCHFPGAEWALPDLGFS